MKFIFRLCLFFYLFGGSIELFLFSVSTRRGFKNLFEDPATLKTLCEQVTCMSGVVLIVVVVVLTVTVSVRTCPPWAKGVVWL